jgi:Zn-finger nucleic acid-binding protein
MFDCPACSSALDRTSGPSGIVWVCPNCKGRAVNISLLRRQLNPQHFNRMWQTVLEAELHTDRKCPACEKPMVEVPITPPPDPLVLDACRPCQFVWFDASELEKIPKAPPKPNPDDAIRKLPLETRQMIAEHQVRIMGEEARRAELARSRDFGGLDDALFVIAELFVDL